MDATALWAFLIAGCVVLLALLALAAIAERPRTPKPDVEQLRAAADELSRHAAHAQTQAGRAVAAAMDARAAVAAAERRRDEAWTNQETREEAYAQALRAAQEGRRARPLDPAVGDPEREREVGRAALSAYRRGDISVDQLREVWRRTAEPDPQQEGLERAAERARIEMLAARRVHDRASAQVRHADQAARVAEVAAEALVAEAAESAAEAQQAQLAAQLATGTRRPRRRPRRRRPDPGRARNDV